MRLLRYQVFLAYGISFITAWMLLINIKHFEANIFVTYAPLWSIVMLGFYLLTLLIIGVRSFNDCPEASRELVKDILEAEQEMKKCGII
jgi:Dolichol-phosphate mannosyltransferase subunit 3 (DPM3)